MVVRDLELEERKRVLEAKIETFLLKLPRITRVVVKKHMKNGMDLYDALREAGYPVERTERNG